MSSVVIKTHKHDGSNTLVTVTLPGKALTTEQVSQRKHSYVNSSGVSVEATVDLPGYTPSNGNE